MLLHLRNITSCRKQRIKICFYNHVNVTKNNHINMIMYRQQKDPFCSQVNQLWIVHIINKIPYHCRSCRKKIPPYITNSATQKQFFIASILSCNNYTKNVLLVRFFINRKNDKTIFKNTNLDIERQFKLTL